MSDLFAAPIASFFESLRKRFCADSFIARHRMRPVDFTRHRQLTFPVIMLFTLQKTARSLQRHLHEFLDELAGGELFEPVTTSAWTHARAKLKHTAFIELNGECVVSAITAGRRCSRCGAGAVIDCWAWTARSFACRTARIC